MTTKLCALIGGPAAGDCYLDVPREAAETSLYFTPVSGPQQRLIYRRVGADRFAFSRSEPYTREPEEPTIVVTHSEEKLPPPDMKDWERRGSG